MPARARRPRRRGSWSACTWATQTTPTSRTRWRRCSAAPSSAREARRWSRRSRSRAAGERPAGSSSVGRARRGSSSWSATTVPTSTPSGPASGRRSSSCVRATHTASRPAGRGRAPGTGTARASRRPRGRTRRRPPRKRRRQRLRAATSRRRRATSHASTGSAMRSRASDVASGAGSFPSREPTAPGALGPTTCASGRPVGRRSAAGRSVGASRGRRRPVRLRAVARVLAYGTTWAGGGLRCTSAETGLTCRNRSGHGFFLSRETGELSSASRGGGSCHREPCGGGSGSASAWRRWRPSPRRARSAARARGDERGCREADAGGRRRRRRPRHQRSCGDLLSREVRRGVRGGLARGPHADAERRFPVPSLGWRLHRRRRMQSPGLRPGRRRGAVRRVDGKAGTDAVVGGRAGRLLGPVADGFSITFHVPAGGGSVLNFSVPQRRRRLRRWRRLQRPLHGLEDDDQADRSFTATASQNGVVNGANAKVTYFVTGRFQGKSATGAATAAGVYREDIVVRRHAQPQVHVEQPALDGGSISTAGEGPSSPARTRAVGRTAAASRSLSRLAPGAC